MESSARELFRLKAIQVSISGPAAAAGIREKERIVNQYVLLSRIFDSNKMNKHFAYLYVLPEGFLV
jgi:hypothetical protein